MFSSSVWPPELSLAFMNDVFLVFSYRHLSYFINSGDCKKTRKNYEEVELIELGKGYATVTSLDQKKVHFIKEYKKK